MPDETISSGLDCLVARRFSQRHNHPMTRWLLVTPEYPPDTGGVARYLGVLGEDARLAVASPHGPVALDVSAGWLPLLLRVRDLVRANDGKGLLISHLLPYGYPALVAGVPYAALCHGLDVVGPLTSSWKRWWARLVLRRAKIVIANSEATKAIVLRYGIASEKVRVVHPPLSWDAASCGDAPETDLGRRLALAGKRVLLVAGRLVERKGVDIAIEAMRTINQRMPDAALLVAGDGPMRSALEERTRLTGIADHVVFTGHVSDAELRDAYRAASIVLLPAKDLRGDIEGYGIAAADAGLFGKPVVASRTGGLVEAVEDGVTGILAPPGNPQALTEAIFSLLEAPERAKRLGEGGRVKAAKWTQTAFREAFFQALG